MTKPRDPGSIDEALAKIAGQVPGAWKSIAFHVGRSVFTVRKWGDEASPREISVAAAIKLDILFQQHGGVGRPLYDCYGYMLGAAVSQRFTDQFCLVREAAGLAAENGEAEEALLLAALPDADADDRRRAKKELLDSRRMIDRILPLIDASAPEERSQAPP